MIKKTLLIGTAIFLLTNKSLAATIPNFINNLHYNSHNSTLTIENVKKAKVFPNPEKWQYIFTTGNGFDYWYSPKDVLVTNREEQRIKAKVMFYSPREERYYISNCLFNYSEGWYVRLNGEGFNITTGKKEFESTNQKWVGTKYYFTKNETTTMLSNTLREYIDKPSAQLIQGNIGNDRTSTISNNSDNNNLITSSSVIPGHVYIPGHTKLNVELIDRMDCKKSQKYQIVTFKTTENLIINGVVVIPAGTVGKGQIYDIQKPGGFGRKGVVRMEAQEIKTLNSVKVPLMQGLGGQGKTDGGSVAVAAFVSLAGGFFMKGSGVSFEPGTNFTVEVRHDTDLGIPFAKLKEAMNPNIPHGIEINLPMK